MEETIGLGTGIFLFITLSVCWLGCLALIIDRLITIEEKSGWKVVGLTLGIIVLLFLMGLALYIGGDQMANGYHMY